VGDNSLPYLNTACDANPKSSGEYSCGGKIGKYLGIYKNIKNEKNPGLKYLNLSQIRAYSYTANSYRNFEEFTSPIGGCYPQESFLNVWKMDLLTYDCRTTVTP